MALATSLSKHRTVLFLLGLLAPFKPSGDDAPCKNPYPDELEPYEHKPGTGGERRDESREAQNDKEQAEQEFNPWIKTVHPRAKA